MPKYRSETEKLASYLMTHDLEQLYTVMITRDFKTWTWNDTTRAKVGYDMVSVPTIYSLEEGSQRYRLICGSENTPLLAVRLVRLGKYVPFGSEEPVVTQVVMFREFNAK